MNTKNLRVMPLRELQDLQQRIGKVILSRRKSLRKAREQIAKIASSVGCSARELLDLRRKGAPPKRQRAARPKYVNPKDPKQTWSGRGRRPAWWRAANGHDAHASQ